MTLTGASCRGHFFYFLTRRIRRIATITPIMIVSRPYPHQSIFPMKSKFSLTLFAVLLVFFACKKEQTYQPIDEQTQENMPVHLQQILEDAEAELDYDYNHPPSFEGISDRSTVYVPAGSQDALANAIDQAGWGGTVIVRSGKHWESGTVVVNKSVKIFGEEGAKFYVDVNGPGSSFPFVETNVLDPAIYVKKVYGVWIKNLEIYPTQGKGNTGIFLEGARRARIQDNTIEGFQFGVWASDQSHGVSIYDNIIIGYEGKGVWGAIIESGNNAKIKGNFVADFSTNVFVSDNHGIFQDNEMEGGDIGILLCTVQGNVKLPNGSILKNAIPSANWKIVKNDAHDNYWNYLVIDGANNNCLGANQATNAGLYDIELAGPTSRFGAPAPTSSDNVVYNLNNVITTKDCGVNNFVFGGNKINTQLDPCF